MNDKLMVEVMPAKACLTRRIQAATTRRTTWRTMPTRADGASAARNLVSHSSGPNAKVRGPEAALSPEAPSRLPG